MSGRALVLALALLLLGCAPERIETVRIEEPAPPPGTIGTRGAFGLRLEWRRTATERTLEELADILGPPWSPEDLRRVELGEAPPPPDREVVTLERAMLRRPGDAPGSPTISPPLLLLFAQAERPAWEP